MPIPGTPRSQELGFCTPQKVKFGAQYLASNLNRKRRCLSATNCRHDRACPDKPFERTHFAHCRTTRHLCRGRSEQTMVVYPPEAREPSYPRTAVPRAINLGNSATWNCGRVERPRVSAKSDFPGSRIAVSPESVGIRRHIIYSGVENPLQIVQQAFFHEL